jgi:putative polyhydroxyalkanoate system protein
MRIERRHTLGLAEARTRVEKMAAVLQRQFDLDSRWDGDRMQVSGNGVNGELAVSADTVNLDIRLGLALRFMESSIRAAIEQEMDKQLS